MSAKEAHATVEEMFAARASTVLGLGAAVEDSAHLVVPVVILVRAAAASNNNQ